MKPCGCPGACDGTQFDCEPTEPSDHPPEGWEECDCCGCYHPADYAGDCRDDERRWP